MKTKRVNNWRAYLTAAILFVLSGMAVLTASAEEENISSINVRGIYGQTEARGMLDLINDFRTGEDAWYWNEDNATKTVYDPGVLEPLEYDYELEQAAMLRAMEIAVSYSHTRPSGGDAFVLFRHSNAGENIAAGYRSYDSAADVFKGWQETDEDYSGQGHRRNMLSPDVTAVGIGYVYFGGYHFWVQLFRSPSGDMAATEARDGEETVSVDILSSMITSITLTPAANSLTVTYGSTVALPEVTAALRTAGTWPSGRYVEVYPSYVWTAANDSGSIVITDAGIEGTGAGTAVIATSFYDEELEIPVTVEPASIGDAAVSLTESSFTYDGTAKTPAVSSVTLDGKRLMPGTDYTVSWSDNINAGTATVTVTGTGNYQGMAEAAFEIEKADLGGYEVSGITDRVYSGSEHTQDVAVRNGSVTLESGTDYLVAYTDNQNAGMATVTVTGTGNYKGTVENTFQIEAADLSDCTVGEIVSQVYSGSAITPSVTVTYHSMTLETGRDFEVSYTENIDAGTATATLSGKGNYQGTAVITFEIEAADLSGADFAVDEIAEQMYSGSDLTPAVTVRRNGAALAAGTDYTVAYQSNQNAGTAEVTVTGQGNYKGVRTAGFEIRAVSLTACTVSEIASQEYSGNAIIPAVTVRYQDMELAAGTDYEIHYTNNLNAGTAAAVLAGRGNYKETVTKEFEILPVDLSAPAFSADAIAAQTYSGSSLEPSVMIKRGDHVLAAGTDYTLTYRDNQNVGTAAVTVTGTGNYKGTVELVFEILPADLSDCTVGEIASQVYSGSAITPAVTVTYHAMTLEAGRDFEVRYTGNINTGTATVTLSGKGNYQGKIESSFQIVPAAPDTQPPSAPETEAPSVPETTTPSVPETEAPPVTETTPPSASDTAAPVTPAKGKKVTDRKTGVVYKITKAGTSRKATVEYVRPSSMKATVKIPDTVVIGRVTCKVTSVAANAFKNNKKVKKVTIGKYVTNIGKNAFYGCKNLQKVTIGKSVKTIGASAFCGCTKLSTVTIGAKVSSIGAKAFSRCTALKKLTLPASVKTIGKQAFYGCKNLKTVTVKTTKLTAKTVGSRAFGGISSKATFKVPAKKLSTYKKLLRARGISSGAKVKKY